MKIWLNIVVFSYALWHLATIGLNIFCLIIVVCCLIDWLTYKKIDLEVTVKINDKST